MKIYTREKLKIVVSAHRKWVDSFGMIGARADLSGADLRGAYLSGVNFRYADLRDADLRDADLRDADLRGADLSGVNFRYADLRNAYLCNADLANADLSGADLSGADLRNANLRGANIDDFVLNGLVPLTCPSSGSFIAWKKAEHVIVKLEVCEEAERSSSTGRKCRCSAAKVLAIENIDGTNSGLTQVSSDFDPDFVYKIGEIVSVPNFDKDRKNECAPGIHFFITREEAVNY